MGSTCKLILIIFDQEEKTNQTQLKRVNSCEQLVNSCGEEKTVRVNPIDVAIDDTILEGDKGERERNKTENQHNGTDDRINDSNSRQIGICWKSVSPDDLGDRRQLREKSMCSTWREHKI